MNARLRTALLVLLLIAMSPAPGRATPAKRPAPGEAAQLAALRREVAAQAARIATLERKVRALLAAQGGRQAPAARAGAPGPPPPAPPATPAAAATPGPAAAPAPARRLHVGPATLGGDVYLYQYLPMSLPGASPKFELYAFSMQVDGRHGPWGFHSDYRLRTTKLRSFFPGNTWLQQGYVSYTTPLGDLQAGSFYRRVGLAWDDSFFGNIEYFDGLMLDPEFGVGFTGAHRFTGRFGAHYSFQYFANSAPINGSLPGRDFVSEPGAAAKNDVTARFAPIWHFRHGVSLMVGASAALGTITRDQGPHNHRRQLAGDVTFSAGGVTAYGEILRQRVDGVVVLPPRNATYSLAGVRWSRGRYHPRLNFSQVVYHDLDRHREYIIQPGITVDLADGFSLISEVDWWRRITFGEPQTVDRSLNLVLHYHF